MSRQQVDGKLRAEGRCRLCLRLADERPLTRHRIVPGRVGGSYTPVNCVPLCRPCHDIVDDWRDRDPSLSRMYRRMLRASMWPEEIAKALRWQRRAARGLDGKAARRPDGSVVFYPEWHFDREYPIPTREMVLERRIALSA